MFFPAYHIHLSIHGTRRIIMKSWEKHPLWLLKYPAYPFISSYLSSYKNNIFFDDRLLNRTIISVENQKSEYSNKLYCKKYQRFQRTTTLWKLPSIDVLNFREISATYSKNLKYVSTPPNFVNYFDNYPANYHDWVL